MASLVTFGEIKQKARRRADMENSTFVKDAELSDYVNDSIKELYDLLVQKFGNDYFVKEFEFQTQPGVKDYDLPEDFYKLKGVDLIRGETSDPFTLSPFMFIERNRTGLFDNFRYRIIGNQIRFIDPETSRTIRLWYVPVAPLLSDDADTFDTINGYEEYVVLDAAIKMLQKEEADVQILLAQKGQMELRIDRAADNRDEGQSQRVTDVRRGLDFEEEEFLIR